MTEKDFDKKFDFKDIKFSVKLTDIHKLEKKEFHRHLVMKIRKNIESIYQKNVAKKKNVDLLLIGEGAKKHYILINDFNRSMYDHSLHRGKKTFLLLLFSCFHYRRNFEASY